MKERDVIRQLLDYLAARRRFAIRLNTGSFYEAGRAFRAHNLGPGVADILVPAPGSVWIEAKAPEGRLRPSQVLFESRVTEAGFKYVVARSIDDLAGVV